VWSSGGGGEETEAYFSPNTSDYPGSLLGKTYTITAEAWSIGTAEIPSVSDTDSYDVVVYRSTPTVDEGCGMNTCAWGHAKVDVAWNGQTAEAIAYGEVSNSTCQDVWYGISIRYQIVKLWPDGDFREVVFNLNPPILDIGRIESDEATPKRSQ